MSTTTEYTLAVRNARIVDGCGGPARVGDLGVIGERIVAIGHVPGRAAREIDADGRVLAPGFIDIHTHYDPQLCWDQLATPTPEHGVTTIVMGNCSVTLAPVRPEHRGKLIKLFGSVEDMESRLLEASVPFTWQSFPEYLDHVRAGLGPNVGAFVGHAVLRLFVMGEAAQQRTATDAELATLCRVLREALDAGALGLSFTFAHLDELGHELPCVYADRRERLALLQVMAEAGRGLVEVAPNLVAGAGPVLECIDEFGELALATGVTCSLSPLLQSPLLGDLWQQMLQRFEHWQARGAPLFAQTQVRPLDLTMRLSRGSVVLAKNEVWRPLFEQPLAERIRSLRDPDTRQRLRTATEGMSRIENLVVSQVQAPANRAWLGRRLKDIAAEQGRPLFDVLADIALADELETEFSLTGVVHADTAIVGALLDHPGIHIGSGDAGAHINQFSGAGDTCYLFQKYVREEGLMSLERAVQRLTSDLARAWRIADRGELVVGNYADLVVFDPDTISRGEQVWVDDVPGSDGRFVRHATGVYQVIVNGQVLVEDGVYTAARPGRLI